MITAISFTVLVFAFVFSPEAEMAQGYSPEVGIPDSEFEEGKNVNIEGTDAIGRYVKAIYNYGIGVVGILAAVVLMVGGVVWLTAGGNVNKVESAKQWIGGALTGLVLALTSYMLLYQINPDLVNFRTAGIGKVDPSEIDLPEATEQCLEEGTQCARVKNQNPQDLPLCVDCCDGRHHFVEGDTFCGPSPSEKADDTEIGCCVYGQADECETDITKEECKDDKNGTFVVGEDLECKNQSLIIGTNYKCE